MAINYLLKRAWKVWRHFAFESWSGREDVCISSSRRRRRFQQIIAQMLPVESCCVGSLQPAPYLNLRTNLWKAHMNNRPQFVSTFGWFPKEVFQCSQILEIEAGEFTAIFPDWRICSEDFWLTNHHRHQPWRWCSFQKKPRYVILSHTKRVSDGLGANWQSHRYGKGRNPLWMAADDFVCWYALERIVANA